MKELYDVEKILTDANVVQEGLETLSLFVDTLSGDIRAANSLVAKITNTIVSFRDKQLYNKLLKFIKGINSMDLPKGIKEFNKLFDNSLKGKENAKMLTIILDQIDEEDKIDFMINATYSCMIGLIDQNYYFRMIKVISQNLYQDLMYLAKHIRKIDKIKGDIQVHSLANSSLMIQASVIEGGSVEEQEYTFTSFARDLDKYSLSLHDEEAQKYYSSEKKDTLKLQNEARGNKVFTSSEEPTNMKTGDIWIRVNDDK